MPYPIEDRPTPPGHPGAQPIEEVDVNGKKVAMSTLREYFDWGAKKGYLFQIPQGQGHLTEMGRSFGQALMWTAKGDRVEAAKGLKGGIGSFLEVHGVHKLPDPDMTGVPPRAGVAAAIQTGAHLLEQNPAVVSLYRLDPARMRELATECEFLIVLEDMFEDGQQHVASVRAPLTKDVVADLRPAAKHMRSQVEASLTSWQQAEPLYTYLDAPHEKAVENRRSGARREEAADHRAEERLGAAARTEARREIGGKYLDAVAAALTEKK